MNREETARIRSAPRWTAGASGYVCRSPPSPKYSPSTMQAGKNSGMAADARTWSTPMRPPRDRRRNRFHISVSGGPCTKVMLSPLRYEVADTASACRRPSRMFASMFSGLIRVSRNRRRGLVSTRPRVGGAMREPPETTAPANRSALTKREGTSVRITAGRRRVRTSAARDRPPLPPATRYGWRCTTR